MSAPRNILVVCGTSVATSTVVAETLREQLPDYGVELGVIEKTKASGIDEVLAEKDFDVIVSTAPLEQDRFDVPIVKALSFMTGQGQEETLQEIAETLQS